MALNAKHHRLFDRHGFLIATDVAARGLDIPNIEHVVHYQVHFIHQSCQLFSHWIAFLYPIPAGEMKVSSVCFLNDKIIYLFHFLIYSFIWKSNVRHFLTAKLQNDPPWNFCNDGKKMWVYSLRTFLILGTKCCKKGLLARMDISVLLPKIAESEAFRTANF